MAENKVKQRNEIDDRYKWDIGRMYSSPDAWKHDLEEAVSGAEEFSSFHGRLGESAAILADALTESDRIEQKLEKAYVFARMKLDEDNRDAEQQAMHDKALSALASVSASMSFVSPEITSIPEETIEQFLKEEPRLKTYEHILRDAMRQKQHVLSEEEENILAQLGEVLGGSGTVFTMLNNADIRFGDITDESGERVALTHGNYIKYMRSKKRSVRKDAYDHCYDTYRSLINTIAANYNINVKTDVIRARMRRYGSSRASALSGGNIPETVYDRLVDSVNEYLPVVHEYIALRKELLGLDELKMYDVYVPLIDVKEKTISFNDAVEIALKGLAPLGREYLDQFKTGIEQRWIDVYENEGKTSGAYSFGSYDSYPYVLMNFDHTLNDMFTLVHEMGHSMHSYYTRKTQPFVYGGHSIFTAEVASTVNETLLMKYLISHEEDPEMKKYLLNMYIEAFRSTLFRQTMFAEFEHMTHSFVESGGSLTAEWMCGKYDELNRRYFGPALGTDEKIAYEWARIPHFYRSFYVYQYATGYSAANAITDRILTEGEPAVNDYLRFLASGASDYPVDLLKIAGVDMTTEGPVKTAMETFKKLVTEFKALCRG